MKTNTSRFILNNGNRRRTKNDSHFFTFLTFKRAKKDGMSLLSVCIIYKDKSSLACKGETA